jgi:hypothetical protein
MWKSYADDGLTVEESDGVAKIYGIIPHFPERYVDAGFELSDAMPITAVTTLSKKQAPQKRVSSCCAPA